MKEYLKEVSMKNVIDEIESITTQANQDQISYEEYLMKVCRREIELRKEKEIHKKLKLASLPKEYDLRKYNFEYAAGINKRQLNQLMELNWMERTYNLILMGPSGVGKSYLAGGLVYEAIKKGYTGYFRSMQEITRMLKLKDHTASLKTEYERIKRANLIVIDDMMMFPIEKGVANELFHLINNLHEKTSLIITTNKGTKEWAEVLNDEVLAAAILDRLLYRCEVIKLDGKSYRLANRKNIFD